MRVFVFWALNYNCFGSSSSEVLLFRFLCVLCVLYWFFFIGVFVCDFYLVWWVLFCLVVFVFVELFGFGAFFCVVVVLFDVLCLL